MKVLVTGGSGRLGNVLVRKLVEQGHEVHVLVLPTQPDPPALRGLNVQMHQGNILDKVSLAAAMKGAEVVYHLAAKLLLAPDKDGSIWTVNVTGTRYVAEVCMDQNVGRMVHCSTHFALQQPFQAEEPLTETHPLDLENPVDYYRSKAHAEQLVCELVEQGLPALTISPGMLVGPHDFEPSLFGKTLLALAKGKLPYLVDVRRDFVDVRDVADAMVRASHSGMPGQRYLLPGHRLHTRAVVKLLEEVLGHPLKTRLLPTALAQPLLSMRKLMGGMQRTSYLMALEVLNAAQAHPTISSSFAARDLAFTCRELQDSLADTLQWFRSRQQL